MTLVFWAGAGVMLVLAALAGWRERRRKQRDDLDQVGLVNWPTVQVLALLGVVIFASLAVHD